MFITPAEFSEAGDSLCAVAVYHLIVQEGNHSIALNLLNYLLEKDSDVLKLIEETILAAVIRISDQFSGCFWISNILCKLIVKTNFNLGSYLFAITDAQQTGMLSQIQVIR